MSTSSASSASSAVKSALFVDFDNIYQGLFDQGRNHANAFARKPEAWLARLEQLLLGDHTNRDFLIRRCYLNPDGSPLVRLDDEVSPGGRKISKTRRDTSVVYRQFRTFFTKAGFEVIDCPSLTNSQKNAADIRIALDVLELVLVGTPADEFMIASGDADFTPLLHRINARDKRSFLISAGAMAAAVSSAATRWINGDDTLALISPPRPVVVESAGVIAAGDASGEHDKASNGDGSATATASPNDAAVIATAVLDAAVIESAVGAVPIEVAVRQETVVSLDADAPRSDLGVSELSRLAKLPRADRATWAAVIEVIAETSGSLEQGEQAMRRCRDGMTARGITFGRHQMQPVLGVMSAAGLRIAMPQTRLGVAQAIVEGAVIRCMAAGGTPSEADIVALKRLIGVLPALEPSPESDDDEDAATELSDDEIDAAAGRQAASTVEGFAERELDPPRSLIHPPTGTRYDVEFPPPSLGEVA